MGERVVSKVLDGGTIRVLGSLDQPHSWTYVPDLAAAMIRASERPDALEHRAARADQRAR